MGMLKAELVSKKQNHDEKIVWELLKSHCCPRKSLSHRYIEFVWGAALEECHHLMLSSKPPMFTTVKESISGSWFTRFSHYVVIIQRFLSA